jgi:cysteinyl-tRNA synthetase
MDDDFNTPEAVAVLFDLAAEFNRSQDRTFATQLKALAAVVGLLQREPDEFLKGAPHTGALSSEDIEVRIAARAAAKKSRNFAEADRLRDELKAAGVILEDTSQGTTWRSA